MRTWLPAIAALCLALPGPASADVEDAVNWARLRGCHAAGGRVGLQSNAKLKRAAARLAGGAHLHEALTAEGYLVSESAELHFSGAVTDAQISRTLTSNYCATLTDPKLREMGVQRRGQEVWMVLAAPVRLPSPGDAESVSRQILAVVNEARAAGRRCGSRHFPAVAPLSLNASLTGAALAHSREMAAYGEFDHRGHDGSTPSLRVQRAGFGAYRIVGENIAAGPMTPAAAAAGWLASPPHCENIMDGRFTQIGIAYAANLNSAAGLYWTEDFAAAR